MHFRAEMMHKIMHKNLLKIGRPGVSTTPGSPGNLLEFVWSSWKFLCKMSMIDCIGFQS